MFVAFRGFAIDALGGPNAKTPGIFFCVLAMWLLAGRRWFWGALAAGLDPAELRQLEAICLKLASYDEKGTPRP